VRLGAKLFSSPSATLLSPSLVALAGHNISPSLGKQLVLELVLELELRRGCAKFCNLRPWSCGRW